MQLFYSAKPEGNNLHLDEEETRHAIQVLRKSVGDELHLCDGEGHLYLGRIRSFTKKVTELELLETQFYEKRKARLHLVVAPTKNMDRVEWMLEKCVEIGLEELSFIQCAHSERKVLKMDRLEKIQLSAAKQSSAWHFTKINPMVSFKEFLQQPHAEHRYIASLDGQEIQWSTSLKPAESSLVLIGPEGDFSTEELQLAKAQQFQTLSLGNKRLRTETAGVQTAAWFSLFHG
ncbi:MAG: 16S rRNA (uracil(1498)-N(3))-methyltransferase [Bacteroidetes bacterium]|nr:MAG: 16S rRNA (uracil(1498)-N(3))-methyltransferase [Bacteroidota bacterium]